MTEGAHGELIRLIYTSITDPPKWRGFLNAFATHLRLNNAILTILYPHNPVCSLTAYGGLNATDADALEYAQKWADKDPWVSDRDLTTMEPGRIVPSQQLCPDHLLEQTLVYQQYLAPRGYHYGGGVMLALSPHQMAVFSCARPKELGPLSDSEIAFWQSLVPHLQAAVQAQGSLQQAQADLEVFRSAFNSFPSALVLTNQDGAVFTANQEAHRLLQQRDGIGVSENRIVLLPPARQLQKQLDRHLTQVGYRGRTSDPIPADITIPRSNDKPPLLAILTSVPGVQTGYASTTAPTVRIQLIDPLTPAIPHLSLLTKIFGLTNAEAQVCLHLASDRTVEEIARATFVSESTIRTHLKRCLAKTNTRRQAELLALLQRISVQQC